MRQEQARALIIESGACMNDVAINQTIAALETVNEERRTFRGHNAFWYPTGNADAPWQASLTTHSTHVKANLRSEPEAIVWLADRIGALNWSREYATRTHAEVVPPVQAVSAVA